MLAIHLRNLRAAPLLAAEVRSPTTALVDLNLKKATYERFGVPRDHARHWVGDCGP